MNKIMWSGAVEGYAKKYIAKNLYRVNTTVHSFEDLMQDAYTVYLDCISSCRNLDNPAMFMSMYKVSLRNKLFDNCEYYEIPVIDEDISYILYQIDTESMRDSHKEILLSLGNLIATSVAVPATAEFRMELKYASKEIKSVLSLILSDSKETLQIYGKRGFLNNGKLCELLGYCKYRTNLVDKFMTYFSPN